MKLLVKISALAVALLIVAQSAVAQYQQSVGQTYGPAYDYSAPIEYEVFTGYGASKPTKPTKPVIIEEDDIFELPVKPTRPTKPTKPTKPATPARPIIDAEIYTALGVSKNATAAQILGAFGLDSKATAANKKKLANTIKKLDAADIDFEQLVKLLNWVANQNGSIGAGSRTGRKDYLEELEESISKSKSPKKKRPAYLDELEDYF